MANNKVMEIAYCQVFGVSKEDARKEEHQRIIAEALDEVWSYSGNYEGESETMYLRRVELDSPMNGEASELAAYFKELYPELSGEMSWNIIFIMYKRLKALEGIQMPVSKNEESIADLQHDLGLSDTTTNIVEKETHTMNETGVTNALDDIQRELQESLGADVTTDAAMPTGLNAETAKIAKDQVRNEKEERINFSRNSVVSNIVFASPAAIKKAVNGEQSTGTIKDPKDTFMKFCEKLVPIVDDVTGNVTFKNVVPGQEEDALRVYNALKEAIDNPAKTFPIFVSKSSPAIKGIDVFENGADAPTLMNMKSAIELIMTRAWGVLNTKADGIQLQLKAARNTSSKKSAGAGIAKKKSDKNPYSGIASIVVTNRKEALDKCGVYHKALTDDKVIKAGFKSDMCVKYYKGGVDSDSDRKVNTYRIPLQVEQYVCKPVEPRLIAAFGTGESAASSAVALDLNDEAKVNSYLGDIAQLVAEAAASGVKGELFDDLRANAASAEATAVKAEADEFAGVM